MNVGKEFTLSHRDMLEPLIGRLVQAPVEGEKVPVLARIMSVEDDVVVLKAVPKTTNH